VLSPGFTLNDRLHVAGDKCVIENKNGVLKFYVGDTDTPMYTAGVGEARFPMQVMVRVGATPAVLDTFGAHEQGVYKMTIDHTNPRSFLYTREMQQNDFPGGIPATVTIAVSRLSEAGEGLEATAVG
jgi:hypothetical protein